MIDDDTHDKLTKAYMAYFKANEKFEARNSVRTHREARRWLREIRNLAKERMDEIHDRHITGDLDQNEKGNDIDSDN